MSVRNEYPSQSRRKAKSSALSKLAASYQEKSYRNDDDKSARYDSDDDEYSRKKLMSSAGDSRYIPTNQLTVLKPRKANGHEDYRRRSRSQNSSQYSRGSSDSLSGREIIRHVELDSENSDSDNKHSYRSESLKRSGYSNGNGLVRKVNAQSDEDSDDHRRASSLRISNRENNHSDRLLNRGTTNNYRRSVDDRFLKPQLRRSNSASSLNSDIERYRISLEHQDHADEARDVISSLRRTSLKRSGYDSSPTPVLASSTNFHVGETRSLGNSAGSDSGKSDLSQLSIKEARLRLSRVGTMSNKEQLIGEDAINKFFPERKVHVFVGTYNMGESKELPKSLMDFLLPESTDYVQHMYAIGLQEALSSVTQEWTLKIQETLGPDYVLYHSCALGALHLVIFIKRDLIWYTSVVQQASISTRPGPSSIKTKGAIAVNFHFFGTSLLFLNCHLTAHEGKSQERIDDYNKIISGLNFSKDSNKNSGIEDVTSGYDCVFWMGDLNVRVEKDTVTIENMIKSIESNRNPDLGLADYTQLLNHDELKRVMRQGLAFKGFLEGRIKFRPTFKYEITDSKDVYSKEKNRIPSYTDRILYRTRTKNAAACLVYDCVLNIRTSDHRPVYGVYEVFVKPSSQSITMSGGHFNRDVWIEGVSEFPQACPQKRLKTGRRLNDLDDLSNASSSLVSSLQEGTKRRSETGTQDKNQNTSKQLKQRVSSSICLIM